MLTPYTRPQMEVSRYLREYARTVEGKQQLIIAAFAKSLECIPRQLCDNAGFDATDLLNKLRMRHAQGHTWDGVDIESENVADNMLAHVWEPALIKINALGSAAEAACLILSVDETIKNEQSERVSRAPVAAHSSRFADPTSHAPQPNPNQKPMPPGTAQRAMRGRPGVPRR